MMLADWVQKYVIDTLDKSEENPLQHVGGNKMLLKSDAVQFRLLRNKNGDINKAVVTFHYRGKPVAQEEIAIDDKMDVTLTGITMTQDVSLVQ